MISANDVYSVFLTLISPESTEGADRNLSLCTSSLEKLMKNLRSDADLSDSRIAYAAACDAYYVYALSLMADVEENADFKAGDLTVKRRLRETLAVAEQIKKDGEDAVRELLRDNSFGAWSI